MIKKAIKWILILTAILLGIFCFLIYERLSYAAGDTCMTKVPAGKSVTLTAKACPGSRFVKWGGACSGTFPICTFTMSSDMDVSAEFELIPYPTNLRLVDLLKIWPDKLNKCAGQSGFIDGM